MKWKRHTIFSPYHKLFPSERKIAETQLRFMNMKWQKPAISSPYLFGHYTILLLFTL